MSLLEIELKIEIEIRQLFVNQCLGPEKMGCLSCYNSTEPHYIYLLCVTLYLKLLNTMADIFHKFVGLMTDGLCVMCNVQVLGPE